MVIDDEPSNREVALLQLETADLAVDTFGGRRRGPGANEQPRADPCAAADRLFYLVCIPALISSPDAELFWVFFNFSRFPSILTCVPLTLAS